MFTYTLHDAIRTAATLYPKKLAFLNNRRSVTYERLYADVDLTCRYVLGQGLTPGDRALIALPFTYLHILLILALDRLGIASSSVGATSPEMYFERMASLGIDHVFAPIEKPADASGQWSQVDATALADALDIPGDFASCEIPDDRDPDRIVRLVWSSGTTGEPSVVALDRTIVLKRLVAHQLYCEGKGTNRYLIAMPVGTIAGYGWLLMALCRGAAVTPGVDPASFAGMIETLQLSHLLLTPQAFRTVVLDGERATGHLSSVRSTTTGGAPVDIAVARRARMVLGPEIWNAYASTEASSVARGDMADVIADPSLIGTVLPFVTVEIVDDGGAPLPPGETGIVRIASDLAVDRYEGSDDGVGTVFRDGFYYPGDLGSLDAEGRLRLHGRADSRVNLAGNKVPAEQIEARLRDLPSVEDAAVFEAETDRGLKVVAAVVAPGGDADAIATAARDALGSLAPAAIRLVDGLPRNDMGKIDRRLLARQFGRPDRAS